MRLHDFVFGSGVDALLVSEGRLPDGWCRTYCDILAEFQNAQMNRPMISREVLHALHFASMYLPIRYTAWTSISRALNNSTLNELGTISFSTELFLWERAANFALESLSHGLRRLCFVVESPLNSCFDETEITKWETEYLVALGSVREKWAQNDMERPVWDVMAIRFASFYLDWKLRYEVTAEHLPSVNDANSHRIAVALRKLSQLIANPTKCSTVHDWLTCSWQVRDGGGLPVVGRSQNGTRRALRIRAPSESLIFQ